LTGKTRWGHNATIFYAKKPAQVWGEKKKKRGRGCWGENEKRNGRRETNSHENRGEIKGQISKEPRKGRIPLEPRLTWGIVADRLIRPGSSNGAARKNGTWKGETVRGKARKKKVTSRQKAKLLAIKQADTSDKESVITGAGGGCRK